MRLALEMGNPPTVHAVACRALVDYDRLGIVHDIYSLQAAVGRHMAADHLSHAELRAMCHGCVPAAVRVSQVVDNPLVTRAPMRSGQYTARCGHCTWEETSTSSREVDAAVRLHKGQHREGRIEVLT